MADTKNKKPQQDDIDWEALDNIVDGVFEDEELVEQIKSSYIGEDDEE